MGSIGCLARISATTHLRAVRDGLSRWLANEVDVEISEFAGQFSKLWMSFPARNSKVCPPRSEVFPGLIERSARVDDVLGCKIVEKGGHGRNRRRERVPRVEPTDYSPALALHSVGLGTLSFSVCPDYKSLHCAQRLAFAAQ